MINFQQGRDTRATQSMLAIIMAGGDDSERGRVKKDGQS